MVSVDKSSAAAKAGLKVWDLIIAVNGKPINSASELKNTIGSFPPNEVVEVRYIRDKKEYKTKVKLDKSSEKSEIAQAQSGDKGAKNAKNSGLVVENIDRQMRQRYQIPSDFNGVIVSEVAESSAAARAGFESGDIITQIEDVKINNVNDFNSAMKKYNGKTKRILVLQSGGLNTIILK